MSTTRTPRKRKVRINNDQFFVLPRVARLIAKFIKKLKFYRNIKYIVEPAAGNGELLVHFWGDKKRVVKGYDYDPQCPVDPNIKIEKQDFLTTDTYGYERVATLIITGPPFGKRNSLVIKFFNKAAQLADFIGMILPRSFKGKESIWRRLNRDFYLYAELDLEDESFYLPAEGPDKKPYPVPCVFQVWYRRPKGPGRPRRASLKITRNTPKVVSDFEFVKDSRDADIAMISNGWSTGNIVSKNTTKYRKSLYLIRVKHNVQRVVSFFENENWKYVKNHVVGQRSISKKDIIRAYNNWVRV